MHPCAVGHPRLARHTCRALPRSYRSVRASITSPPVEPFHLHQALDAVAAPASTVHRVHRRQFCDWIQSSPTLKICEKEPAMTSTRTAGLSAVHLARPRFQFTVRQPVTSASGVTSHYLCPVSRLQAVLAEAVLRHGLLDARVPAEVPHPRPRYAGLLYARMTSCQARSHDYPEAGQSHTRAASSVVADTDNC